MQELKLADDMFPGLLSGDKECTIRSGKRNIELGYLAFSSVSGDIEPVVVDVIRVSHTLARYIHVREAQADGAVSVNALLTAMRRFYPDLTLDDVVTIVEFKL